LISKSPEKLSFSMQRSVKRIEQMTPEQALAFLTYRRPGVEETDMTGMFSIRPEAKRTIRAKRRPASD
jgi:hypothetical protein